MTASVPPASHSAQGDRLPSGGALQPEGSVAGAGAYDGAPIGGSWIVAELVEAGPPAQVTLWGRVARGAEGLFGVISLVVALSLLAGLPGLQLLGLGYLLEGSGRVAVSGSLRNGLPGIRKAARLGGAALGAWLWLLPVRYVSSLRNSALLIDPTSEVTRRWNAGLLLLLLLALWQIGGALARGGRLRDFLWPQWNPGRLLRAMRGGAAYRGARDGLWEFVASLRLSHYFRLGLGGFLGGLAWLVLPVTMIAVGREAPVWGWIGGLVLVGVVFYIPFLQVHFATTGRLRDLFAWRHVRRVYRQAPWACCIALLATLLLTLPLYLLKIEMVRRDVAWLPGVVFVLFILPARLLTGWAWGRAVRGTGPRWWLVRWPAAWLIVLFALAYAIVVWFTQYTSWYGVWSLYEQHAFLVPVPFLGI